jgi:hypothetical protein
MQKEISLRAIFGWICASWAALALVLFAFATVTSAVHNRIIRANNHGNIIEFPLTPTIFWFDSNPRNARVTIQAPSTNINIFRNTHFKPGAFSKHNHRSLRPRDHYTITLVTAKNEHKVATIALNAGQSISFMAPAGQYELMINTGDILLKSNAELLLAKETNLNPFHYPDNEVFAASEFHFTPGKTLEIKLDRTSIASAYEICGNSHMHPFAGNTFGCRNIQHTPKPIIEIETITQAHSSQ